MAAKISIGYFLEDRGHEIFLTAIVARMAREKVMLKKEINSWGMRRRQK